MIRTIPLLILILSPFSPAIGQTTGFGVGITLGEPTGLSGKVWLSEHNGIVRSLQFGNRLLSLNDFRRFGVPIKGYVRFPFFTRIEMNDSTLVRFVGARIGEVGRWL